MTYFGSLSLETVKKLIGNYENIQKLLYSYTPTKNFTYNKYMNVNAYIVDKRNKTNINIGSDFFELNTTGFYTKGGVIIHEASHLVVDTGDEARRIEKVLQLASENSTKALNNSDTYQFFSEDINQ